MFSGQPCDSGLEVRLCAFLDRCTDVDAFAKLAREVRFSLEYRADNGRLAFYYPDFVVRRTDGEHLVVETKGVADADVPRKDARARRWASEASLASGSRWQYFRINQDVFERVRAAGINAGGAARRHPRPGPRNAARLAAHAAQTQPFGTPGDHGADAFPWRGVRRRRGDPTVPRGPSWRLTDT